MEKLKELFDQSRKAKYGDDASNWPHETGLFYEISKKGKS